MDGVTQEVDQRMRTGSTLVRGADVADEDDEQGDEGKAKEQERGEDEQRHGSLSNGPTGAATAGRGRRAGGGCGQATGVAASLWRSWW